ncbi:MAG: hypothetical protein C4519_21470 [Desulfobacteraceae bacterium]|nr:MAG: hypothetical protein C4519_21470 [Desulfobacteraceae bacterium]
MDQSLRTFHLAFIGRVIAGVSHEFKNHLAVVNELSGLLGDLLAAGSGQEQERLLRIVRTIGERVDQAALLTDYLNSFAHRMDRPFSTFALNEAVEEELALMQRFGLQQDLRFESCYQENLPAVHSNPALLQLALSWLLCELFFKLETGSTIVVATALSETAAEVEIIITAKGARKEKVGPPPPWRDLFPSALAMLNARLAARDLGGDQEKLVFSLPIGKGSYIPLPT